MYHCCHRRTSWGGGGRGAPEYGTISFHFLGTDNDKIKIVGGNIIGKKLLICGKNNIVKPNFLEISEILISSWIFKKLQFQLLVYVCMGDGKQGTVLLIMLKKIKMVAI